MYHYLGRFQLYETSNCDHFSDSSYLCKIDDKYQFLKIKIVGSVKFASGESVEVQVIFLKIDCVASLVKVGTKLPIILPYGLETIGEVLITKDPWNDVETWVAEGEIRKAVVDSIGWTAAGILIEGGIETSLMSQDMGLQAWEEINKVLKDGDIVKVRVEKIDKLYRKIKVSFIDKAS
jgi:ribosomal protein S1